MKARKLRKLLNNTEYSISNHDEYIAVGSPLCHDLIKVDVKTLKVSYALDAFHKGRKSLGDKELIFIWDTLHDLIASGKIKEIIEGNDVIDNPLPVWTFDNGELIESHTDKYGWPNTTYTGHCMYDNTHFITRDAAIRKAIKEYEAMVEFSKKYVSELDAKLKDAKDRLKKDELYLHNFHEMKGETI